MSSLVLDHILFPKKEDTGTGCVLTVSDWGGGSFCPWAKTLYLSPTRCTVTHIATINMREPSGTVKKRTFTWIPPPPWMARTQKEDMSRGKKDVWSPYAIFSAP